MSLGAQRGHTRLATRVALVTLTVAALTALVGGALTLGLVRSAAEAQARRTLGRFAELTVPRADGGLGSVADRTFSRLQVRVVPVDLFGAPTAGQLRLPPDVVNAVLAGRKVDRVATIGGAHFLVESRPAPGRRFQPVLLQPTATVSEITNPIRSRILLGLLVGLGVAIVAGALLARRLSRPLSAAAQAAHRMAAGQRDVRLRPDGPAEMVEVADALNGLASALMTSEGRQREFLLSVSHELRTPLTGIQGFAEALADGVVPVDQTAAAGQTILAEARRLDRLVADLLDLARLGAQSFRLETRPVDLGSLLSQAASVWALRCSEEGVELRLEIEPVTVVTDPLRVRQIIDGLAENALRVAPAGSPIVLAVRAQPSGGALVMVRDGGPGLTPDDFAVAFERGVLHDRYSGLRRVGTGFGLALVAALAQRLGGEASAGPAAEGGAAFAVTLPAEPPG